MLHPWFIQCKIKTFALLYLLLLSDLCQVQSRPSTGGRNVLRRNHTGNKPFVIQHRSQDAVSYYDHENDAKIIKSSHFELNYTLGRKITFFCMAQSNPRPTIPGLKMGRNCINIDSFRLQQCQADNIYAIDRRGFRTDYAMVNF